MPAWSQDELSRIGKAQELRITTLRNDGSPRKPVTIWVIPQGERLYVRSVKGRSASCYRGTQGGRQGRISAGGVEKDVRFINADHQVDDELDASYRAKYRRYAGPILNSVLTPQAREATIELLPL
jgi:Uncharacterized protein conserved in bacteria